MVVAVVKICVCFLEVLDNTIKVISSRSMSLLVLFLDRRRPPKAKSTCIPVPFLSQWKGN